MNVDQRSRFALEKYTNNFTSAAGYAIDAAYVPISPDKFILAAARKLVITMHSLGRFGVVVVCLNSSAAEPSGAELKYAN